MNERTKEEEKLFIEEEEGWVEGDKQGIDKGATTIDQEKASVEENRFVEAEEDWVEGDKRDIDKGATTIDQEKAGAEENRFVEAEENWVEGGKRGIDKGATTIDQEKADAEEDRFFDEEKVWVEGDDPKAPDIGEMTEEKIKTLRKDLPDTSKTAKAIDQGAPWMEISQLAEGENLHEITNLLFEAEQQGLDDE
uniref:Uncharacterized protein n=1 Tax=Candidatus Kentrum eta TaxID=2126337 RepID=A0A450UZH5_9GAMM|nr:MAG: hypothetical protein BECKH772A_GA0070896_1001723 [Candidatus Kentron sp. H]VFJ91324.1 MAG: hypothetical protein BECKH772B_GA0070898_1001623 [Candidatus Kentron sp. H]VFJ97846.1 MAG: hypothetical protein BECKH772C_GA0070978_1001623 [Candidatus Kentron sp. H]